MIHLLKPFSFLPALLLMYAIYTFSGQTGDVSSELSYRVSCKVVTIGSELLDKNLDEYEIEAYADRIHFYIRKCGHMTEYFLLAVAVSFPLYVYGLRGLPLLILAGGFCLGFAGLDEYHQSFVEGRGPSKRDVCIDGVGILVGITLVRMFCWTTWHMIPHRKKKRRR